MLDDPLWAKAKAKWDAGIPANVENYVSRGTAGLYASPHPDDDGSNY